MHQRHVGNTNIPSRTDLPVSCAPISTTFQALHRGGARLRPHEVAFGHKRQAQGSWAARVLAPQPVPMACAIEHMPEADGTDTSAATRMPHAASALLVHSRLPACLPVSPQ